MERLHIEYPIIVEGRYDKIKLSSLTDATVIATDGFGIFNAGEKRALLRRIAGEKKLIVLTDSDGAGLVIRNHLRGIIPADRLINVYVPPVRGKEKRKKSPSKEGLLGVEGVEAELLRKLLLPFSENGEAKPCGRAVTKQYFYEDGLSGQTDSAAKRAALAKRLGLPANMSSNALLEAINLIYTYEQYKENVNNG